MSLTCGSNISSTLHTFLLPVVSLPHEHQDAIQHIINDAIALQSGATRRPLPRSYDNSRRQESLCFKPRMDLFESTSTAGARPLMTATFELPGLRKEDVHIEVFDNKMVVVGNRQNFSNPSATQSAFASGAGVAQDEGILSDGVEGAMTADMTAAAGTNEKMHVAPVPSECSPEPRERYTIREIKRGRFKRVVLLPSGTKPEEMKASMHDGILTVTFPGSLRPAPHNLPVA